MINGAKEPIVVLLYTDDPFRAKGLESVLEATPEFGLLRSCGSIAALINQLAQDTPDVLLLDLTREVTFDVLAEVKRARTQLKIVLWADSISTELAFQAMGLGVRGILRRTLPLQLQVECLMKVHAGELWFEKALTHTFLSAKRAALTAREGQIVRMLAEGLKNRDIASELMISEGTLKVYLARLFQKVGAKDRFELVLFGLKNLSTGEHLRHSPASGPHTGRGPSLSARTSLAGIGNARASAAGTPASEGPRGLILRTPTPSPEILPVSMVEPAAESSGTQSEDETPQTSVASSADSAQDDQLTKLTGTRPKTDAPQTVRSTRRALRDESVSVRLATIEGLGQMADPSAVECLRTYLAEGPSYEEAEAVIRALEAINTPECRQCICDALENAWWSVRESAITSLVRLEVHDALIPLLNALRDSHPRVRAAAARALDHLNPGWRRSKEASAIVSALVKSIDGLSDRSHIAGTLEALERIGNHKAEAVLARFRSFRSDAPKRISGIFISYRRQDVPAHAGRLYDRLREHFDESAVFMDLFAISPGDRFQRTIADRIGSCDVMVALIGPRWSTLTDDSGFPKLKHPADLVRLEIATALKRGIRLVPVLIDDTPIPKASELPDDLRALPTFQALRLRENDFNQSATELITFLEKLLDEQYPPIRIVVCDDHPVFRDGLCKLLMLEPDFRVVAQAQDGRQVLDAVQQYEPDIVLLDLTMPGLDGFAALQQMQAARILTRVIVLTASDNENDFVRALKLGVMGIGLKQTATEVLVKAIRRVHAGEIWLDSHTTASVFRQFAADEARVPRRAVATVERSLSTLSRREREVVALAAQGYNNEQIAAKMLVGEQTVRNHLHNILEKSGVSELFEVILDSVAPAVAAGYKGKERRANRRFGLQCAACYKVVRGKVSGRTCKSKSVNLSANAICFTTRRVISRGTRMYVAVDWPVLRDDKRSLRLLLHGAVVRSGGGITVLTFDKYEFRVKKGVSAGI